MIDSTITQNLRSKYSPEGSELRNLQNRMVEMLEYFDSFCKKHEINYWLSHGTCLGAIRHGGFIPWDDDVDIELLPNDYKKLIALRSEFENQQFVIQDNISDIEYITPYPKLRDKKSLVKEVHNRDNYFKYKGVFIDIFIREPNSMTSMKISHIIQYIFYSITNIKNKRLRLFLKKRLFSFVHKTIFPLLKKININKSNKSILFLGLGYGFYNSIDQNWIFPLTRVKFENLELPVPAQYDKYLKSLYGDYMQIPTNTDDFRIHFKYINLNIK